jgi:cytochrome P450
VINRNHEGASWRRQRRLTQAAFHRQPLQAYAESITSSADQVLATWKDGETRDLHQEIMQLTLRIMARVLFSMFARRASFASAAHKAMFIKTEICSPCLVLSGFCGIFHRDRWD